MERGSGRAVKRPVRIGVLRRKAVPGVGRTRTRDCPARTASVSARPVASEYTVASPSSAVRGHAYTRLRHRDASPSSRVRHPANTERSVRSARVDSRSGSGATMRFT